MADLKDRMIRAAKLDINLYEEVEADKQAMGQAMTVVILSSVAAGVGSISSAGVSGIFWGTVRGAGRLVHLGLSHVLYRYPDSARASDPGRRGRVVADHRLLQFTRSPSGLGGGALPVGLGLLRHRSLDAGGDGHRRPAGTGLQKYGPGRGSLPAGLDRAGGS